MFHIQLCGLGGNDRSRSKPIVFPALALVSGLRKAWEPVNKDIGFPEWCVWGEDVGVDSWAATVTSFPTEGGCGVARGRPEEAKDVANA